MKHIETSMDSKHPWIPNIHGMSMAWLKGKGLTMGLGVYRVHHFQTSPNAGWRSSNLPWWNSIACEVLESKGSRQAPGKNHRWWVIPWGWSIFFWGSRFFFVSGHPESCLKILSLGEVFFWMSFWPQKSWFSGGSLFISGSARGFMMGWDEQINRWKWFLNISNSHQSSSGGDAKNRDFWQTQYTQSEASFRAWIMQQLT
jgi:hypothetical protein